MTGFRHPLEGPLPGLGLALALAALSVGLGPGLPAADALLAGEAGRCLATDQWLLQWAPDLLGGHGSPYFLFRPTAAPLLSGTLAALGAPDRLAAWTVGFLALVGVAWLGLLLGRALWSPVPGALLAAILIVAWPASGLVRDLGALLLLLGLLSILLGCRGLPAPTASALLVGGLVLSYLAAGSSALVAIPPVLLLAWTALPRAGLRAFLWGLGAAIPLTAYHWVPALLERGELRPGGPGPAPPQVALPFLLVSLAVALISAGLALRAGTHRLPSRKLWAGSLGLLMFTGAWLGLGLPAPAPALGALACLALGLSVAGMAAVPSGRSGTWLGLGILSSTLLVALLLPPPARPRLLDPPVPGSVRVLPPPEAERFAVPPGCQLKLIRAGSDRHFVDAVCGSDSWLKVRLFEFPGWTATVDNLQVQPRIHPLHGTIEVPIAAGAHRVELALEETRPRIAGRALTLAAAVWLLTSWIVRASLRERT